jgi:hypothetical protein
MFWEQPNLFREEKSPLHFEDAQQMAASADCISGTRVFCARQKDSPGQRSLNRRRVSFGGA